MYSIGKIAQEFKLSRSALLYYDSIGLLKPSSRSSSGYRQYSKEDKNKLQQICAYRQMGLSIKEIQKLIDCLFFPNNPSKQNTIFFHAYFYLLSEKFLYYSHLILICLIFLQKRSTVLFFLFPFSIIVGDFAG